MVSFYYLSLPCTHNGWFGSIIVHQIYVAALMHQIDVVNRLVIHIQDTRLESSTIALVHHIHVLTTFTIGAYSLPSTVSYDYSVDPTNLDRASL